MSNEQEVESNVVHAEPHDVRLARKVMAKPYDNQAEDSVERILARALIRLWEKSNA